MAKGDIFEPVLEILFEITARIFVPRVGSSSISDELSWSWFVVMGLVAFAQFSFRSLLLEMYGKLNEEQAGCFKNRLRFGRWALWGVLFFSLFMFRFASSI